MVTALRMFYTSIGRKLLMALTGSFLCLYLVEHLYGNLLLFKYDGGKAFNEYTETLTGNMIIRTIEYVLFAAFIIHALTALFLTIRNNKARPIPYEVSRPSQNSSWFSRNMGLTGSLILFFLIVHLRNFFFPHRFGHPDTTMAVDVATAFQNAWYAALYVFSMVILGAHLNHGFQSAFQTLGLNNKKYNQTIKYAGTVFALIMMVGFGFMPIMFYFNVGDIAVNIIVH